MWGAADVTSRKGKSMKPRKESKKILAVMLALTLSVGTPVTAFAEEPDGQQTEQEAVQELEENADVVEETSEETQEESVEETVEEAVETTEALEEEETEEAPIEAQGEGQEEVQETEVAVSNDVAYTTLQSAVDAAEDGTETTITLQENVTEDITVPEGKNIVLNLNGKTVTNSTSHTIYNKGTLKVVGDGTVDNVTHAKAAVYNEAGAVAELNGGSYVRSAEAGSSSKDNGGNSYYVILNHGTMTVNATVGNGKGAYSSLIENGWYDGSKNTSGQESVLTINDGTFTGGLNTIKNDDYGNVTINGGEFTNDNQGAILNWNKATINDGTFHCDKDSVILNGKINDTMDKGELTITGGSFSGANDVIKKVDESYPIGTIQISGGTFAGGTLQDDWIKDGFELATEDGVSKIVDASKVAVGETKYLSLQEAFDAAASGSTIKVLKDFTCDTEVKLAADKKVTLDLNQKTITFKDANASLNICGELTVEDADGSGKIVNNGKTCISVEGADAKLTLNNGQLINNDYYGIYAKDGGSVVVNGGTVTAKESALSGNNTTGEMNFEINGGTVTAGEGPAIYMPGQVKLTVKDGVLNGGISLRMGQVDISGGTINAITSGIDSPTKYYNYSGNAWLPDALYVFAGTYANGNEANGNSLNLNITGGTFNCTNDQGSAVAIYDLGKVAQDIKVNISGDAKLMSKAADRDAYQVVSLSDIGVTEPADGFGNEAYTGKAVTVISGGTFSTPVKDAYCAEGMEPSKNADGTYTVAKVTAATGSADVKDLTDDAEAVQKTEDAAKEEADKILEDIVKAEPDQSAKVEVKVQADKKEEADIKDDAAKIADEITDKTGEKVTGYYDVNVLVTKTVGGNVSAEKLKETTNKIPITISVDGLGSKYVRVAHVHDGKTDILPYTADYEKSTITVEMNQFSVIAVLTASEVNVAFNSNGGSAVTSAKVAYGQKLTKPADPTKTGYDFAGWYKDAALTEAYDFASVLEGGDFTLYAKWTEKKAEPTPEPKPEPTPEPKPEPKPGNTPFKDVPGNAYYEDPVQWALDNGITTGTSKTTFSPDEACTRAQAVTLLWRSAGCPAPSNNSMPFKDVQKGWYYEAVQWAVENGITTGTSATTFSPNDPCTRGQIATLIYRAKHTPEASGKMPFKDVPQTWYYNAVQWAVNNGITTGTSATTFSPNDPCTRAQIVTFLYRAK